MLPVTVPGLVTDFDVLPAASGFAGIRLMLDTAGALHYKKGVRGHGFAQAQSMLAVTLHAELACC